MAGPQYRCCSRSLALALCSAGIMQVLLAASKLGGLVRYVPYPVHAGYMNGVAVLMVMAMLPHLLGLPAGQVPVDWRNAQPLAPVIALVAFLLAVAAPQWTRRVPPYLTGLLTATALHHLLAQTPLASALGPLFNAPHFDWPGVDAIAPLFERLGDGLLRDKMWLLIQFAAAVAFVSSLQTALAGSTIDELTHQRGDRGRTMLQQGVANVALGFMGGLASAGAVGRSKVNIDAGGRHRNVEAVLCRRTAARAGLRSGLDELRADGCGRRYFCRSRVLAGRRVDPQRHRRVVAADFQWRMPSALAQSYGVMLLVAGIAIFVSLPLAIGIGVLVAVLMFIRSNIKRPIRQVIHANQRTSRKVRPAADAELLRTHGLQDRADRARWRFVLRYRGNRRPRDREADSRLRSDRARF